MMQVVGGICFAHGPYEGQNCPEYERWAKSEPPSFRIPCIHSPRKPEYVAMAQEQMRQTNKVYTQSDLDTAVEAERAAVVQYIESLETDTASEAALLLGLVNDLKAGKHLPKGGE